MEALKTFYGRYIICGCVLSRLSIRILVHYFPYLINSWERSSFRGCKVHPRVECVMGIKYQVAACCKFNGSFFSFDQ